MDNILAIDIGGTDVKYAICHTPDSFRKIGSIQHLKLKGYVSFGEELKAAGLLKYDEIAISTAGYVNEDSIIEKMTALNWINKDLKSEIKRLNPRARVSVINDGEAHLMAHLKANYHKPVMCLALGTSPAFAISDRYGNVLKPDELNFDMGSMRIDTTCSNKEVWFALGSRGLEELENTYSGEESMRRFGYRLGSLLANLCNIFRPRTIILTGGIITNNSSVVPAAKKEFDRHYKKVEPQLLVSPFGQTSGLVGAVKNHLKLYGT